MVRRHGPYWCVLATLAVGACSSEPTAPTERPAAVSSLTACTADPAQIVAMINSAFTASVNRNSALGKWNLIEKKAGKPAQLATAQKQVLDLIDYIVKKRAQGGLVADDALIANLINQLLCFVGLPTIPTDLDNVWVVNVGDPLTTFVTVDRKSGIQFPSNAVSQQTIVTATLSNESALVTELDKYPFVYDWTLIPSQTLQNGAVATVGVCPNPASLSDVPAGELDDLLGRLVLGHQRSATAFEVLARVPIPVEMTLDCGEIPDQTASSNAVSRMLRHAADWFLPTPAMAATRKVVGGVGGNTSEFSPLGPVDPVLRVGGVGGNTSEFSRMDVPAMAAVSTPFAGTVGTQRTTGALPTVSIATRRGTPIAGVGVTFTSEAPATLTPVGNASVCGADSQTDASGNASVLCLHFGTTVNLPLAYTKLRATFTVPAHLSTGAEEVITFEPPFQTWLVESYGATIVAFTSPPAGRTGTNGYTTSSVIPVTVEIRSALGEVVPIATPLVDLILSKNAFAAGTVRQKNAVGGIATFNVVVPTAASGYWIIAEAPVAGGYGRATSNVFDVIP